jgi:formate dehydrogenase subunit delta
MTDVHADIIRMANQIARSFGAYPDHVAVKETAEHLRLFWDPRMREQLYGALTSTPALLSPVARAAAIRLHLQTPA